MESNKQFPANWRLVLVVWWLGGGFPFSLYRRQGFKSPPPIQISNSLTSQQEMHMTISLRIAPSGSAESSPSLLSGSSTMRAEVNFGFLQYDPGYGACLLQVCQPQILRIYSVSLVLCLPPTEQTGHEQPENKRQYTPQTHRRAFERSCIFPAATSDHGREREPFF